jgi:WD40 repeat protein
MLRLLTAEGTLVKAAQLGGRVNDVVFSASGSFATAGPGNDAKLFRHDGSLQSTLAHRAPIKAIAISPDGSRVATGGDDERVVVFSASGRLLHEFSQEAPVTSLLFSERDTLVSGGRDGSLEVWDADSGRHIHSLARHGEAVRDLAVAPGGLLATASDDRTARVYDLRTGELKKSLEGHLKAVNVVAFSPKGRVLLTASTDGELRTWSTRTWKPDVLRGRPTPVGARHVRGIAEARFSPDGRWIITAGPTAVGIWQTRTGDLLYFIRGHQSALRAVAFAPNSWQLLTASVDGTMRGYRCDLCGKLPALQKLAESRLRLAEHGR